MYRRVLRRVATLIGSAAGLTSLILLPTAASAAPDGAQAVLTAVSGSGSGLVLIAPTAQDQGTFAVEVAVNVHDASPNMVYTVSRAAVLNPDGVCTLASGWLVNGPLTTSPAGAGKSIGSRAPAVLITDYTGGGAVGTAAVARFTGLQLMLQPGVMFTGRQVFDAVVVDHSPEGIPIIVFTNLISQSGNFFLGDTAPLVCAALSDP